jgi:rubredoxin
MEGNANVPENDYKIWMCIICGWVYEEEKGCPEEGLAPGTRWKDIPEHWVCPECSAGKEDFEMIEL